ncbi:hypothetical protein COT65_01940 [Candidatus Shapirobacteria bacterium CG09_land_8_20_14_0_10_47_13]|uniref:DUF5659 domain-containing protein n=2 Tax=Microgenomates group TaxID=1794810 RepID=A0A2M7QJA3_9BACT|nr:MAG: hypothetical protein COT65_01940 [Candidatus Shapirobacteria bacterium CG09_land_8_20_14_0_10_47_13]PIY72424.1 MAG: hypothetical protein COY87_01065 [Candidatus Roizmanbacteria bacterium CG_4_10_14_0_8_um_filter_33_9]
MVQENLSLNDYYSTSDLALAAVISLWFPMEFIDRTNPHKAAFLFRREKGLEEIVESFWKRDLKIEPQAYFSQIKAVKARLYGES